MAEVEGAGSPEREPLWIRILEFPLVALVVATALFIIASLIAYTVLAYLPPMSADAKAVDAYNARSQAHNRRVDAHNHRVAEMNARAAMHNGAAAEYTANCASRPYFLRDRDGLIYR